MFIWSYKVNSLKGRALCKVIRLIFCLIQFKNSRCKIAITDIPAFATGNEYRVSEGDEKKAREFLLRDSTFICIVTAAPESLL